jgi:hypothetical protein
MAGWWLLAGIGLNTISPTPSQMVSSRVKVAASQLGAPVREDDTEHDMFVGS